MTKAEIEEELKTLEAENEKLKQAKKSKSDANRELADEIKLLETENEILKKELAAKRRTASTRSDTSTGSDSTIESAQQEVADTVKNTSRTIADESSKVLRGVTLSFFEPFRVYAEAVSVFADQISGRKESQDSSSSTNASRERNQPEDSNSSTGTTRNLPGDIFTGMAKSINKLVEIPGRTIERFYEGYKESPESSSRR